MSKRKILRVIIVLVISILVILLYFYTNDLRCIFINQNSQFLKSQEKNIIIYSSVDTPNDTLNILHELIRAGANKNKTFWGKELSKAIVIYCHNQSLYKKYGQEGMPAVTRLGTYVIIPPTALEEEIFSHEFCHTQIFNLLKRSWWIYYQRLPSWFDEGIALQFNNHGIYSEESLQSIEKMSLKDLRKIDRPRKFYDSNYNQLLNNYCVSKLEIKRWLKKNDKEDLINLIRSLSEGKDFYKIYSK